MVAVARCPASSRSCTGHPQVIGGDLGEGVASPGPTPDRFVLGVRVERRFERFEVCVDLKANLFRGDRRELEWIPARL
jgi:hypothetical protein